jgi:hypothetical protein
VQISVQASQFSDKIFNGLKLLKLEGYKSTPHDGTEVAAKARSETALAPRRLAARQQRRVGATWMP